MLGNLWVTRNAARAGQSKRSEVSQLRKAEPRTSKGNTTTRPKRKAEKQAKTFLENLQPFEIDAQIAWTGVHAPVPPVVHGRAKVCRT